MSNEMGREATLTEMVNSNFYSIHVSIPHSPNRGYRWDGGEGFYVPYSLSGKAVGQFLERVMVTDKCQEMLASFFRVDEFFVPASGVYFGVPDSERGISRIAMYVYPSEIVLYFRRSPWTRFAAPWLSLDALGLLEGFIEACIKERLNAIITGPSGIGKTRFMFTLILPRLYARWSHCGVILVESVSELRHFLLPAYRRLPHIQLALMEPGLGGKRTSLSDVIIHARTGGVGAVVFQEIHTAGGEDGGIGFATPDVVHGLLSSGVQYVTTMHPQDADPVAHARRYISIFGGNIGKTIIYALYPAGFFATYVDDSGNVLPVITMAEGKTASVQTSAMLPESVREVLSNVTAIP